MPQELRLSVSKCKTFKECKAKFNYTYNLKLPRKERDYHIFGKFCHKVLEDFHLAYINGSSEPFNKEMSKAWKNTIIEYKDKITEEMRLEIRVIIEKYLKIMIELKHKEQLPNVLAVEKNFNLNIGNDIILNGMIDRIQLDPDGIIHIADYKSSKSKKYLKNDWFQLLTYAYTILQENPDMEKFRVSYIMMKFDWEYITKEFTKQDLLAIKGEYIKYAQDILKEEEFEPTVSPLCKFCDHVDTVCDIGRNYIKKREQQKIKFGECEWI